MPPYATVPTDALPFRDIRVLDLSRIIAGPIAGQILADLGADVIKVESPGVGDMSRTYVAQNDQRGRSPIFRSLNRNKRSIEIDLKAPGDVARFLRLVNESDVLIHNFRPGVMEKLGVGHAELSELNSRLVYCAISGFGDVGPMRSRAANDVTVQAYGGTMSYTGEPGRPPVRSAASVADVSSGLYATIGIMAALHERASTGLGQEVKTSLYESQLNVIGHDLVEYWINGSYPTPMGSGTRLSAPNEVFPTLDGSILLAAVSEAVFKRLCLTLQQPELSTDARFIDVSARRAHRDELAALIAGWTATKTSQECIALLEEGGIPCSAINNLEQVANDAQLEALEMAQDVIGPEGEVQRLLRLPFIFGGRRFDIRSVAPDLGAHTNEIVEELGLDTTE